MPRAHRIYAPGHVWHLTHRCHEAEFLLRFRRDRRNWVRWLYEARRRFDLCVFDYNATSNHIHLLVQDRGEGEIARSMQLLEGCNGQQFNRRKSRQGAFWQDSYNATAVETGIHLARCLVYIDLNMVRAGVVAHPREWETSGYHEIQEPRARYRIIDRAALAAALEVNLADLPRLHSEWVEAALRSDAMLRQARWSEAVAVGSRSYAERVLTEMGDHARGRYLEPVDDAFIVREGERAYGCIYPAENDAISPWIRPSRIIKP